MQFMFGKTSFASNLFLIYFAYFIMFVIALLQKEDDITATNVPTAVIYTTVTFQHKKTVDVIFIVSTLTCTSP